MSKMPFNKKASDLCFNIKVLDIDPIHGTCHLCTCFKIDRIKIIFYVL